ncbi:hypothetical protein SCLCIDRAFT_127255, partial [Scleroderma citrinum Foug A]
LYYNEIGSNKHVPRAVLVDIDVGTVDSVRSGPLGECFTRLPYIFTPSIVQLCPDYTESVALANSVLRKEAEGVDCLQGFQITHSLGDAGAGMGTLLMLKIRDGPEAQ